jgi:hypothetical protein
MPVSRGDRPPLDNSAIVVHSVPMEPAEHLPRLPRLQESVHGLHQVGWLEKLRRRTQGEQGRHTVSENGNNNNSRRGPLGTPTTPEHQSNEPTPVSSALDSVANKAVEKAIKDEKSGEQYEPGSDIGRIFPALVGGPQRSGRDDLWDPHLLAPSDSDEYKRAIANPPPATLSKRDQVAIRLVHALAPHTQDLD